MGDVVRYTEGDRELAVYGLEAKATSIRTAAAAVDDAIDRASTAARTALDGWRGPHSATMADQHNEVVAAAFALYRDLSLTAARLDAFPAGFVPAGYIGQAYAAQQRGAEVRAADDGGTVAAVPADLRLYATTVTGAMASLGARAAVVDHSGLRAEVTASRALTPTERDARIERGADPRLVDQARISSTEPYPVEQLVPLVAPTDDARRAGARSQVVGDFTRSVADAIEDADSTTLSLLASHPELASFLVTGGAPDVLAGDTALAVLQAYFDELDTAHEGGDPDDNVSLDDLEAAADDESLPAELRAAARYLLDNPTLRDLVDTGADGTGPLGADGDISRDDLDQFLATNAHIRALRDHVDALDTAADGDDPDGYVSRGDLEAAAEDMSLPEDVRVAARYLLDHDGAFRSVADQEELGRGVYGYGAGGFTVTDLYGRLVNGQAYVHDPDAAREFVTSLPVASDGGQGLPVDMSGDDSVRALAGSALTAALGDLTDMQEVISHLPESPGAVRNQLITTYYDMLAQRVDGVAAEQWGIPAGDPSAAGSGGANWLVYAPWASNGVRSAIDGSFSVFGINPSTRQRQGAADGNQWIFDDITSRFAAFVELYEGSGGRPSTEQLEGFFRTSFDEGDAEIRQGFQAYVAALGEDDPTRRQELMFQANTLVATHEQVGAQPYLEEVMSGVPDGFASRFVDIQMGRHRVEVDEDLPDLAPESSNLVVPGDILDLDPTGLTDGDLSGSVPFAGAGSDPDAVNLDPLGGWSDEGFHTSTETWYDERGAGPQLVPDPAGGYQVVPVDPDASLADTGVGRWTDYDDRMWSIHRLFEGTHTDRSIYDTTSLYDGPGGVDTSFLDPEVAEAIRR
ncbi:hypothetical protein PO878_15110 [Iamia majanohamensis]|uniref:Uncharacterized protein n=1 Tax=Iamia majanohamensis TaxID=467976 RepID=A0AAE9YDI8_9ACTN|nr:hypothetical protein [Iamia majanohamensis]WCO65831.1 hypothetical protein PO878_15110 [Iamia majanohamensis]